MRERDSLGASGQAWRGEPSWILLTLGLAGALLIWISSSRCGPGVSADSAKYLSAAQSFAQGDGFVEFDGQALVEHPPFYPLLIGTLFRASGWALLSCARLLGALVFGLVVMVFASLGGRCGSGVVPGWIFGLVALVSVVLFRVGIMVWSETTFVLLVIVFLLGCEFYRTCETWAALGGAALMAALASLTRYVGVALVISGLLWLLLHHRRRPGRALTRAAFFILLAALPLAAWAARNRLLTGESLGARDPSSAGLLANLRAVQAELFYWLMPRLTPRLAPLRWALPILVAAFALVGLSKRRAFGGSAMRGTLAGLLPAGLFVASYLGLLVGSATLVAFDPIDGRLLAPVYLPLALVVLVLTGSALRGWFSSGQGRAGVVLALSVGLWLVYPLRAILLDAESRLQAGGGGVNTIAWRRSETLEYLRSHQPSEDRVIYSNFPDALFALAGIRSRWIPQRHGWNSVRAGAAPSELRGKWPETDDAWLIWFNAQGPDSFLYGLEELRGVAEISTEAVFTDGGIFRLARRER